VLAAPKAGYQRYFVIVVLFFVSSIEPGVLQRLPQLSAFFVPELGYTTEQVGQLNVSGNIGQIPLAILGAFLAARFGPKLFLLIAAIGMIVFPTAMAFVQEFWQMYTLNVLIGACAGFILPAGALLISRWFPAKAVAGPMAIFFSALLLATVFLNPLNLLIANNLGWRNVYLIMVAPAIVALILVIMLKNRPADSRTISAGELAYITEGQVKDQTGRSGGAIAALKAILDWRIIVLIVAVFLIGGASGQLTWVWYATMGTLGIDPNQVALVTSTGFLVSGLYSFVHGWVVNHVFRGSLNLTMWVGGIIGILGYVAMVTVFGSDSWVAWALMVCIPVCLMISMVQGTATAYVNAIKGPGAAGTATGVITAAGLVLGFFIVSASGGWLDLSAEGLAQYNPIWLVNIALCAPILFVPWLLKRINVRRLDLDGDGTVDDGIDVPVRADASAGT